MNKQPDNLSDMLLEVDRMFKKHFEKPWSLHREVTEADMERTRAAFPQLMAELRQRAKAPPKAYDNGEEQYDADMGREQSDYDELNR
jgi:hypothetical protein